MLIAERRPPLVLVTARTRLVVASAEFLRAFINGDRTTAARTVNAGATIAEDWPGSTDASAGLWFHLEAIERDPREAPWRVRLVLWNDTVVGSINLKGPPDEHADVEIGWGLVPAARNKGLATEASRAVIDWVFASSIAERVIATIPPEHERSQQVAVRLEMVSLPELKRGLPVWARSRR